MNHLPPDVDAFVERDAIKQESTPIHLLGPERIAQIEYEAAEAHLLRTIPEARRIEREYWSGRGRG